MNKRVGKKKTNKNNRITTRMGMIIVISCLILLAVVVVYKAKDLNAQKQSLQVQEAELQEQLQNAQDEYKQLEKRQEYMKTDKYVEDVARSQLGLVYPDDIVVKPKVN